MQADARAGVRGAQQGVPRRGRSPLTRATGGQDLSTLPP
jgi:hypothetical protein